MVTYAEAIKNLANAVLARTIKDALDPRPLGIEKHSVHFVKSSARMFFIKPTSQMMLLCEMANICPKRLRKHVLRRIEESDSGTPDNTAKNHHYRLKRRRTNGKAQKIGSDIVDGVRRRKGGRVH